MVVYISVGVLLLIPKLGVAMTAGTIVEWLVADGDRVSAGDAIYLLETDKAETEVSAPISGVVRIEAGTGESYPVGTCIGEIA
jgi:pyruvate/2-oxoglutarate dehydrogenase complex dihydrolipoamide acyltransferase (E2) component